MKSKQFILLFILVFIGSIEASEKSKEAEDLFKRVGMPFDLEYTQRNPFGIDVVIFFAEGFALNNWCLINNMYAASIDAKMIENDSDFDEVGGCNETIEYIAYEYKKLFHYYLAHLYYLYDKEFDLEYLMKIDDICVANFEQLAKEYVKRKFQYRKALFHVLPNIFAKTIKN